MKYIIEKDIKKRKTFKEHEPRGLVLKSIYYNRGDRPEHSTRRPNPIDHKYWSFKKNSFSYTAVKNRCVGSGRPRSVYRFNRLSRIRFRGLASTGFVYGVRKASW